MKSEQQSTLDQILMRVKDIIIIVGAVGAFIAVGIKYYDIPRRVDLFEKKAEAHEVRLNSHDVLLGGLSKDVQYIKEGVDALRRKNYYSQ